MQNKGRGRRKKVHTGDGDQKEDVRVKSDLRGEILRSEHLPSELILAVPPGSSGGMSKK